MNAAEILKIVDVFSNVLHIGNGVKINNLINKLFSVVLISAHITIYLGNALQTYFLYGSTGNQIIDIITNNIMKYGCCFTCVYWWFKSSFYNKKYGKKFSKNCKYIEDELSLENYGNWKIKYFTMFFILIITSIIMIIMDYMLVGNLFTVLFPNLMYFSFHVSTLKYFVLSEIIKVHLKALKNYIKKASTVEEDLKEKVYLKIVENMENINSEANYPVRY